MKFVNITGGRCWEWTESDITYRAVAWNGSEEVHLYRLTPDSPLEWRRVHTKRDKGWGARSVAAEFYTDITAVDPLSL
ncbi:hypothetical protein FB471_4482 [Amycolatopsis cihanbeyliensis]|uniref:Uncharacterized protein n=1 Tax=Amycolatopsis cihanbeyliensis TaxID=1128664 RepID=A0A542DNP1_AMYCI|nr:hypothetical protein FB471_4482 [Amycolatopsis cihanbeyliensis]